MWYFILFLVSTPVQMGPFDSLDTCEYFKEVLQASYPRKTVDGWTNFGCWKVKP